MSIAVFGDIHGNLEALEAILKDIRKKRRKIKHVVFLGDAITFGPNSSECLKLLQKNNVQCVIGNHEQRMVKYDKTVSEMSYAGIKHMEYIYHQLDNDDIRYIKSMPLEIKMDYKGYKIYFSHYGYDHKGLFKEDYTEFREATLDTLFAGSDVDVVFFGHVPSRKLFINPTGRSYFALGPSGCVKGNKTHYTLFDIGATAENNFDIYRIDVKFNRAKFVKKMLTEPIPEKIKFSKKFFDIDIPTEPKLPNAKK